MANLTESSIFEAGIYQLETTDPVLGGPTGISNLQGKQLANRTRWLYDVIDTVMNATFDKVEFAMVEGLGTAAAKNYGTNVGNLLEVGQLGIGGATVPLCASGGSLDNAPTWKYGFNFTQNNNTGLPSSVPAGSYPLLVLAPLSSWVYQILFANDQIWYRVLNIDTWGSWTQVGGERVGEVATFAVANPPSGWLRCNGAAVSRTTYSRLFAVIGTTFGVGDGSTTFNVPEMRGEFARGWDNGRGIDAGRVFGSAQGGQIEAHNHVLADVNAGAGSETGIDFPTSVSGTAGAVSSDNIENYGGGETRPRNVALLYCIKY